MKAYSCYIALCAEVGDVIVFAETRGKGKVIAKRFFEDGNWEVEYIDIVIHRKPEYDKYYKGNDYMDWNNPEERLILIRDHGWRCSAIEAYDADECIECAAKEYCKEYEAYLQWERSLNENGEP